MFTLIKRPDAVMFAIIAFCVIAIVPFFTSAFWIFLVAEVAMYAISAIGLNVVMGMAGIFSFGQPVFMAVGGYGYAVLIVHEHVNPWISAVGGLAMAVVVAVAIGYPTLRLRSHYFAVATFGMSLIVLSIVDGAQGLSGGTLGIPGIPPLKLFGINLQQHLPFYIFAWILVGISLLITFFVRASRTGRAFRAIATREDVASSLGIDIRRTKVIAFVFSAVFGAISGILIVNFEAFLSPDLFNGDVGILVFAMLFLGGVATLSGPLIGAAIIEIIPGLVSSIGQDATLGFEVILFLLHHVISSGNADSLHHVKTSASDSLNHLKMSGNDGAAPG
jgi:branched-chain amino acid transport system permease protein